MTRSCWKGSTYTTQGIHTAKTLPGPGDCRIGHDIARVYPYSRPSSCPGFSGQWPYLESSLSTPLQLYLCCLKCHGVHLRSLKMFLIGKLGRISLAAVSFLATWGPHGTSMPDKHPITQLHPQNVGHVGNDAFNSSPFARSLFLQCSLVIVITWAISSQPSVKHRGKDGAWEWRDACAAALWAGETTYDAKHVRDSMGVERMSRHISNTKYADVF